MIWRLGDTSAADMADRDAERRQTTIDEDGHAATTTDTRSQMTRPRAIGAPMLCCSALLLISEDDRSDRTGRRRPAHKQSYNTSCEQQWRESQDAHRRNERAAVPVNRARAGSWLRVCKRLATIIGEETRRDATRRDEAAAKKGTPGTGERTG